MLVSASQEGALLYRHLIIIIIIINIFIVAFRNIFYFLIVLTIIIATIIIATIVVILVVITNLVLSINKESLERLEMLNSLTNFVPEYIDFVLAHINQ